MPTLQLRNIKDTTLWKRLDQGFKNTEHEELASVLATQTALSCEEAAERMKLVPVLMPQYTLHDQVHLLRVTELMAMVAGSVVERLNPVELALAILSANFHDHGMVLSGEESSALQQNSEFRIFSENWRIKNPNLREIESKLNDPNISDSARNDCSQKREELLRGMITEFVRGQHAQKSREFVNLNYASDRRWDVLGTNIAGLVGMLCESHMQEARWLRPENGCYYDYSIGTLQNNIQYIGVLLRLADILDFDCDRTPDIIYRSIHFTNSVSVREWEKHKSVQGWTISRDLIRFTVECRHPVYERTVRQFMDWIDKELTDSHAVTRSFPGKIADSYPLLLPANVDRSRIGPQNNSYKYHDLEFSLSREDIVQLLMTDKLYQSPSLCVRELLQNSLDALRHRQALYESEGMSCPSGSVDLEHSLDEDGCEVIRCTDNGVGMDEQIITRFLTRVGRSYYRSPEFEQERNKFRSTNVDFDPCARFGIGFMSCFMLGDRILIRTRRDQGPNMAKGEPLIVEISGLGGLVVIRKGTDSQKLGTVVEVTSRKKPKLLDEWTDQVHLIPVVRGYALATEYKIQAETKIDEIADKIVIHPGIVSRKHNLSSATVSKLITLKQDFNEVDSRLRGSMHAIFLADSENRPTLANDEATIEVSYTESQGRASRLIPKIGMPIDILRHRENATCADGILVAGNPGRDKAEMVLSRYSNPINLPDPFVLDIRGSIKPELTPARTPPDSSSRARRSWHRIQRLANEAHGKLWGRVAEYLKTGMSSETFWGLAVAHGARLKWVPAGILWNNLKIPVLGVDESVHWSDFSDLGQIQCIKKNDFNFELKTKDDFRIGLGKVSTLASQIPIDDINKIITDLVIRMCSVGLINGQIALKPIEPENSELSLATDELTRVESFLSKAPIPLSYTGEFRKCFSVELPFDNVNRHHKLYIEAVRGNFAQELSDLQAFACGLVSWFTHSATLSIIGSPTGKVSVRGLKWLGQSYCAVEWKDYIDKIDSSCRFYNLSAGFLIFEDNNFKKWADLPLRRNNMDEEIDVEDG